MSTAHKQRHAAIRRLRRGLEGVMEILHRVAKGQVVDPKHAAAARDQAIVALMRAPETEDADDVAR